MLKLDKISLEGYKSIKQCRDLKLEKLNVLIGANGSGKSNFLSFFKLLNYEMNGELQWFIGKNGGRDSLFYLGAKVTDHITAELDVISDSGTNIYRMRLADAQPDTLIFTEEGMWFYPKGKSRPMVLEFVSTSVRVMRGEELRPEEFKEGCMYLGRGHRESLLLMAENAHAKIVRATLAHFRFYQFHDTSDQSPLRSRSDLRGPQYLLPDGRNLAACLHLLREKQPECYQRVIETVHLVFPFFRDFVLEPENGGGNFVMLRWKATGSAEYLFGLHQISDGTLRFIALAALLLQPHDWLPPLITIDEPELGLHPYAVKILASLIQDAANFTQLIVATQSATFVDQVEPDDVIVADMVDGATQFERLGREKLKDWLADYTLSQLWETNLIGGRP